MFDYVCFRFFYVLLVSFFLCVCVCVCLVVFLHVLSVWFSLFSFPIYSLYLCLFINLFLFLFCSINQCCFLFSLFILFFNVCQFIKLVSLSISLYLSVNCVGPFIYLSIKVCARANFTCHACIVLSFCFVSVVCYFYIFKFIFSLVLVKVSFISFFFSSIFFTCYIFFLELIFVTFAFFVNSIQIAKIFFDYITFLFPLFLVIINSFTDWQVFFSYFFYILLLDVWLFYVFFFLSARSQVCLYCVRLFGCYLSVYLFTCLFYEASVWTCLPNYLLCMFFVLSDSNCFL